MKILPREPSQPEPCLLAEGLALVEQIASSKIFILPRHIERDEIVSAGHLGLTKALQRYKPGEGKAFKSFAYKHIWGAMQDYLRSLDMVSKGVRIKIKQDGFDNPDLGTVEQLKTEASGSESCVPHELIYSGSSPDSDAERSETIEILVKEIQKLPERTQCILSLYFVEELTQEEIADVLGITRGRVGQIYQSALSILRARIKSR